MANLINTVDIWLLDTVTLSASSYDWEAVISIEEQQRANRFHFKEDQRAFIIYHACKRIILSHYLEMAPKEIVIELQEKGKPFIKNEALAFNLSHTKEMGLLAVSSHVDIGVDIEKIKASANYLEIAKRFFHPEEYDHLVKIENIHDQQKTFFMVWTAKEAILKATGQGIAAGLHHFSVWQDSSHPQRLKHTHPNPIALARLEVPEHYVAALAIAGEIKPIVYRTLSLP